MYKVMHIVIREDLSSPLLKTQLLNVIEALKNYHEHDIILCWFCRIDKYILEYKKNLALKRQLKERGITLSVFPLIAGRFPLKFFGLFVVIPLCLPALIFAYFIHKPEIVHSRSYHSGLLCTLLGFIFPVKHFFDPRSDFLLENIKTGSWKRKQLIFKFWTLLARIIYNRSTKIIFTSKFLLNFNKPKFIDKISIIPNCKDAKFLETKSARLKKYKFVYCGSMGSWNSIQIYHNFFKILHSLDETYNFLLLVDNLSYKNPELNVLKKSFPKGCISIKTVAVDQVPFALRSCEYGLYLMEGENDGRLGVKTVEYLSQGLPIIFSSNLISLTDLNRKYEFGICLPKNLGNIKLYHDLQNEIKTLKLRKNALKLAKNFTTEEVAQQ
ncbi:hypothetical protein N9R24_05255, partial [Amylibacter sp.]|nr:hypothetical protein [Amylibacter sp.]